MDENIDPDIPVWTAIQFQPLAFQCMRQLAASQSVQGTWEDVGDGYRLVGKKRTSDEKPIRTAKGPFLPFRDDSNDPLRDDPRLRMNLTIQLNQPKIDDILQKIRDATGVTLTVENVDTETPLYGSVSWQNTTAWTVLRSIAETPRVQGDWEKVADGYRLRGTQAPQPVAARPNALPSDTNAAVAAPRSAILLCLGLFFTIVVGAALAWALRLRERRDLN